MAAGRDPKTLVESSSLQEGVETYERPRLVELGALQELTHGEPGEGGDSAEGSPIS